MFQAIINPRCPTKKELQVHDVIFRVGDRVIQLVSTFVLFNNYLAEKPIDCLFHFISKKNNYDLEIFNGDLGTVSEVNVADREVDSSVFSV